METTTILTDLVQDWATWLVILGGAGISLWMVSTFVMWLWDFFSHDDWIGSDHHKRWTENFDRENRDGWN